MNQYKKVAFHTLGCKLNFSETSTIARLFENNGFAKVDFYDSADIYVINTCSVTNNADKECRQIVRKALKQNPEAFVAVIGCYAQLKPQEIAAIPGVDLVLGANEKFNILEHVENCNADLKSAHKKNADLKSALQENADLKSALQAEIYSSEIKDVKDFIPSFSIGDRTRSFLKIQDGCDYFCSFCTIPLARGKSRSNSIAETMKAVHEAASTGVKEIVLTGVNIGDFGKSVGSRSEILRTPIISEQSAVGSQKTENFFDLIKELDKIDYDIRFRISSIEPNLLSDEIIEFVAKSKKITPHFHIPLQSGSNKILKLMRRRYERELYSGRVKKIKSLMPHCCIGADVIVGFPNETEEDFMETYSFLNELEVSYLHVFTYSERENTTAVRMNGVVPVSERNRRNKMLQILSEKKKRFFYEQNTGKNFTVLFESENDYGMMFGFTENYIKVKAPFDSELSNTFQKIILERIDKDGIFITESDNIEHANSSLIIHHS